MGVMICSRSNCTNIMCRRYSDKHGYICDECFEELVNTGSGTNIEKFMESAKFVDESEVDYARTLYDFIFKLSGSE